VQVEANAVGLLAWLEPFDVFQKPADVGTSVLLPPCTGLEKQGAYSLRTFNLTDKHQHTHTHERPQQKQICELHRIRFCENVRERGNQNKIQQDRTAASKRQTDRQTAARTTSKEIALHAEKKVEALESESYSVDKHDSNDSSVRS
jgi:hypothetical protein